MADYYSYQPTTDGTTERAASIAKDFQTMEAQLALGGSDGRDRARRIYRHGAYCQSYTSLNLTEPLVADVPIGAQVIGSASTESGASSVAGEIRKSAKAGDTVVEVQYLLNQGVPAYQGVTQICSVGGNPSPQLNQCKKVAFDLVQNIVKHYTKLDSLSVQSLAGLASAGQLQLTVSSSNSTVYSYSSYDASADTLNGLSLKQVANNTATSSNPTYRAFVDYYGTYDYADKWIEHAFKHKDTNFEHGNNAFSMFEADGGGINSKLFIALD